MKCDPPHRLGPAPVAETGNNELAGRRRLRVLVLEDNSAEVRWTQEMLRGNASDIECEIAGALRDVSAQRLAHVDCALVDLSLPDATGLQALTQLRELAPQLPIVVLTGLDDDATGLVALREGAQDHLTKEHADGRAIARSLHFAVVRQRIQLDRERQAGLDLDLHDDLVRQLFAIGLELQATQERSRDNPAVASRISQHLQELLDVIEQISVTLIEGEPEAAAPPARNQPIPRPAAGPQR